jgi:hypothetical protein
VGLPTRARLQLALPSDEHAPSLARHAIADEFPCIEKTAIEDVHVVAGELVTNAVVHGRPPVSMRAELVGDRLRVEVDDCDDSMGTPSDGSRGLLLVGHLSADWGVTPNGAGKTVWAEIKAPHHA